MILVPEYLKNFKCIGSKCEDTCCQGWRVDIDKKTYNTYKKSKNIKLKPLFEKHIKRNHNHITENHYGKLIMNEEGYCPFLDENKMCGLYKEIGEENLSHICKVYPRSISSIDGKLEKCLTVSCPEVARLVLFNEKGIAFEEVDESTPNAEIPKYINNRLKTNSNKNKYFWDIRIFSLNLLQNRNYTLDERMMLLGIVYEKIQILIDNKKYDYILGLLEEMDQIIDSMELKEELSNVPSNPEIQMRIAKELTDTKIIQGVSFSSYLECVRDTLKGIKYEVGNNIDDILLTYKYNNEEYLVPYIQEKPYLLENLLVNEFFRSVIPFGMFDGVWDSYIYLTIIYSMIKFHLIGVSGVNKGMNDKILVDVVYKFGRAILHSAVYIDKITKLIKENGFDTLPYMCIFIKS